MLFQMARHLVFGFFQKAQIPFVAQHARSHTHRQRRGIPHRIEQTGATAQVLNAALRPCQMLHFFLRRMLQSRAVALIASG